MLGPRSRTHRMKFASLALYASYACCHSLPLVFQSAQTARAPGANATRAQRRVWVNSFGRSGSTTVFELVAAAEAEGDVFGLYEPCHQYDQLERRTAGGNCESLLQQLFHCDFTGIRSLWGWGRSIRNGAGSSFQPDRASQACSSAKLVVIKTIDFGHSPENVSAVLARVPGLKVANVVRDPRSIFASMMRTTSGSFKEFNMGTSGMVSMCVYFDECQGMLGTRVGIIQFEGLVNRPQWEATQFYKFLELPYEAPQRAWVKAHFNNDCASANDPYATCRSNSTEHVEGYIGTLNNNHYAAFMGNLPCRNVSKTFGYDTWYYDEGGAYRRLVSPLAVLLCSLLAAVAAS